MKSVDKVLGKTPVQPRVAAAAAGKPVAGREQVDAINQVFAELELAYHNQFHKAFALEGSLGLAKKYWLASLADFSPEVIRRAARHLVQSQEYLPSLAAMIAACENGQMLFGLPSAGDAYREACLAPEPKAGHVWSHPAVYHAARDTGWFALANETQSQVFPQFEYYYTQVCKRVMRGEDLHVPTPKALPATVQTPLTPEQNKARLKALRSRFSL
jgi:hypothetical protein